MSVRGMIMRERTEEALAAAVRDALAELPRATWATVDEIAASVPGLECRVDGTYEVVALGATVTADDVRDAAIGVMNHADEFGLHVSFDRARGFSVFDLAS